jgi:hypothetical protein
MQTNANSRAQIMEKFGMKPAANAANVGENA